MLRDLLVQSAGVLALAVSLAHVVLGETKVFRRVRIEPEWGRRLIRLVWHAGTVAWMGFAVLLIVAPDFGSDAARNWVIAVSVVTFGCGAIANAWATRGRHFGWMAMTLVVGLAAAGISP
jgi:hypothetical protein